MSEPDRYACKVIVEPDGKHAFIELAEDADGVYVRRADLGFTREMVEALDEAVSSFADEYSHRDSTSPKLAAAKAAIAIISALLPPEGK